MSDLKQSSVALLEEAIDRKIRNAQNGRDTTLATVTRVDSDGTTWVRVYGGAEETPVRRMTSSAQVGDTINVVFSGLSCMGVGNVTNPSASVVQVENVEIAARGAAVAAQEAWVHADDAAVAAQTAWSHADDAATAAQNAWDHADDAADAASNANKSATNALIQLGIVQDVVGVLNYVAEHGGFVQTQDAEIVEGKVYFTLDSQTGDYVPVVNPQASQLSSYYEVSEDYDDVMGDFIMAHLAVTSRGLWVLPSGMGSSTTPASGESQADSDARQGANYKMLLSNDGTYIYDGSGEMVIKYGQNIEPSVGRPFYIGDPNSTSYILFTPASGGNPAHISIGGGVTIGSDKTLSELLTADDITVTQNPTQSGYDVDIAGNTFSLVNGSDGAQGPQGPQGETGATGPQGPQGQAGATGPTAEWYNGDALTHTSGTATLATSSTPGVVVGSMYLNPATSLCYRCTAISDSTATWTYAGNLTDGVIDNINVGGKNLVWDTAWVNVVDRWSNWGSPTTREIVEINGHSYLHLVTSAQYQGYSQNPSKRNGYGEVSAGDVVMVSFAAYGAASGNTACVGIHWLNSSGNIIEQTWCKQTLTTTRARYVWGPYTVPDNCVGFNVMVGRNNSNVQEIWIGDVKVERGNVATDWTPAPEDQTTYVDNSVYQSSQPNLSPFFSYQPPTDTRYWVLATNQTTNVYDGWMTFDMSAASQSDRAIQIRPKRQEWVKPGGRYTLLVELVDITSSGTVQWMPRANNAIDQIAFNGSTSTLPSSSFYVSGTALSNAISDSTRTSLVTVAIVVKANATFSGKVRVSLYEGDYSGPYKPYVGSLLYGSAADSVEYIVGTQTAATNAWTGVTKESALKAGKTIAYYLPYAGNSSAATLNLTLSGGGTTGAKNVKYNSNNSASNNVTTHYGAGSVIQMTYDGTYWRVAAGYYDTDGISNARYRTQWANAIKAATAITASRIICGMASGYKDIAASITFDLAYPLLYSTAEIAAGSTGTGNYLTYNGINASSNGTITAGAANKMLYLKGTVNGNTFTIASSGFLTTNVPTTDDGSAYIPLGVMYSATNIYFSSSKELYCYKDGAFGPVSIREAAEAAKVAGNYIVETASNDVWIHSENHGPNSSGVATSDTYGWRIGSVFELVRAGVTYIKMWVENSVAKLRLGLDTSGHVLLDSTGMEVKNSSTSLAKFGTTARVGSESAGHATFSSTGMEVFTDASNSVAEFGSTTRIGLENSGHVELESTGMEVFTNASTSVAKFAASLIEIGKNATSAVIKFCNGKGTIEYNADSSPSSSEDYSSTSYFEVKGADLRLNGTSRAALYSYYTNGSNIGRKISVITKPAELKMFSESSSNLSGGVGTWAMGIIDVTPNGVSIEANSNGSGKIDLLSANNMTLQSTAGQLKLSGSTYSITSPNLFLRALGLAKTKGDSFTVYSVNAFGYLTSSRKTAVVTVPVPFIIYGTTSTTSCTLSGTFTARQNNGYCFGSTASAGVALSTVTVTIYRIQSGYVTFGITGGEQTLAINNDPISVYFSTLTITLT